MAGRSRTSNRQPPDRVIFRIPLVSMLPVVVLALCMTPLAAAVPGLPVLYLVPLGLAYWVLRVRTVVDADAIRVRNSFGNTRLRWQQVRSLRIPERGWVHVVRTDDGEIALPAVRTRHLSLLSAVSGGRVTDPATVRTTAPVEEPPAAAEPPEEQPASTAES